MPTPKSALSWMLLYIAMQQIAEAMLFSTVPRLLCAYMAGGNLYLLSPITGHLCNISEVPIFRNLHILDTLSQYVLPKYKKLIVDEDTKNTFLV
jgi:hypothetical protein